MWPTPATCLVLILFGFACDVQQVSLEPNIIHKKLELAPDEHTKLEGDISKVIDQIHFLSKKNANTRSHRPTLRFSEPSPEVDLNAYYGVLTNLFSIVEPLLRERFIENFPQTVVCILSERQDCGLEAELTKTVGLELGKPLLLYLSSLRTQTCTRSIDEGSRDFLRSYLTPAQMDSLQEMFMNILAQVPLSANLVRTLNGLVERAVTYFSKYVLTLIQTPLEYVKIALQFGIKAPSLRNEEQCEQGDLKQLIMWGINHNVSWSFGDSIIDILLPPEQSVCPYPDCSPNNIFQRKVQEVHGDNHDILLNCDRRNLAMLNDTLCAELLRGSREASSTSVIILCQALSTLNTLQIEQVWSNLCHLIQTLMSPVATRSSDCPFEYMRTSPAVPPKEIPPLAPPSSLHHDSRDAPNLNDLICNYGNWSRDMTVDPWLVTLCSDNEPEEFLKQVCITDLLRKMLSDKRNSWLLRHCTSSSVNPAHMVNILCRYHHWIAQHTVPVEPVIVDFCWNMDSDRFKTLLCEHTGLFILVYSSADEQLPIVNCTDVPVMPGPEETNMNQLVEQSCHYSEWHDVMLVTTDVLSLCIQMDPNGFTAEVCANKTFLTELLRNERHYWINEYCNTVTPFPSPTPQEDFNIPHWCDYHTWGQRHVDTSVVGLCWQHDKVSFQKNICCNATLMEMLLADEQNKWLMTSGCVDKGVVVLPQACRYSEWTRPIIVDMTELALCAELDPQNFTTYVCHNTTVLNNLLANLDNTWLVKHCANRTKPGVTTDEEVEELMGFKPSEQCQYSSWSLALPDAGLLALCWDYDQHNFVLSVCHDSALVSLLAMEPSSVWVSTLCASYTSYGTTNGSGPAESNICLARKLVKQLNLNCSTDFSSVCHPGMSQSAALPLVLRCWVQSLRTRVDRLLSPWMDRVLEQTLSTTVVILLAFEEMRNSSLHITENIRLDVLRSVERHLEEETNFDNKRVLLQCFGRVLTSLMQTGRDGNIEKLILIKEYFRIPLTSLRRVLNAAPETTVRMILQYYRRHKDTLQLSDKYVSTMVSALFQTHLLKDGNLLPELGPLLPSASPADIQALPPLQNNRYVREAINDNLQFLSLEQRRAFGQWYSKVLTPANITKGGPSLIRDIGNLIIYLPFHNFQHLSPAQLLEGLDVLHRNPLTPLQQEFVAHRLIGSYRNLTAQDFKRMGKLVCLADPEDLLAYKKTDAFKVIQAIIVKCTRQGVNLPSHTISNLFLNETELKSPSSITPERLVELANLLPILGVNFLDDLSQDQLLPVLPALANVTFSPAQAEILVEKLYSSEEVSALGGLKTLGSLIVGLKTEVYWTLTSDKLLSSLPTMASHKPGLNPPQANAIATKLWSSPEVVDWLENVEPLLSNTPLLSVQARTKLLVYNVTSTFQKPWNTQQAKAILREVLDGNHKAIEENFMLNLGTVGQGMSCWVLKNVFQADPSPSSMKRILTFIRDQPSALHTSLKKCIIEELYQFEFFSELLGELGAEIALAMPVSHIKKFPADMMDTLRRMITQDPHQFLLLPGTKQELLVDKMVQRLGMYTGLFSEEEVHSLGIMAPFVVDEVFVQIDRQFFMNNLDYLQELCYTKGKRDLVARILQETSIFGPVNTWTQAVLSQVDRFIFFLPNDRLQEISPELMTVARVEKLFLSQRHWEHGEVGIHCMRGRDEKEKRMMFEKQQFVLQFFLGFLKVERDSASSLIPTCEILHSTAPSIWTTNGLTSLSTSAFSNCLELMGQDQFLTPYQRILLLNKAKDVYGPISSLSPSVIAQLGRLALQLSVEELSTLRLTEIRSIYAMGSISSWNSKQLATLFATVLSSTQRTLSQLDSSTLVAMGHIVCGAKPTEMNIFNAVEFSKAVLWLGHLRLPCSEEQLLALVGLLSHSLAFGPMSSWGPEVFIEIGTLAAGLPDMAMSSLVKEQIEGITPLAISVIPPEKFAVVFHQNQISMFSYEQAAAVTADQGSALSDVQRTALAMVLTPWEDRFVDVRGRSHGMALNPSPLCILLLMLLDVLICPAIS